MNRRKQQDDTTTANTPPSEASENQSTQARRVGFFHSLRTRLSLVFLLLLGTLVGAGWWISQSHITAPVVAESKKLQDTRIQLLRTTIDAELAKIEQVTEKLAATANFFAGDPVRLQAQLPLQIEDSSVSQLILGGGYWPEPYALDKKRAYYSLYWSRQLDGRLILRHNLDKPPTKGGYSSQEWYVGGLSTSTGQIYWSPAYIDPISQEWVLTCTKRVNNGSRDIGIAAVTIAVSTLAKRLTAITARFNDTQDSQFWLLDRNNRILSRAMGGSNKTVTTSEPPLVHNLLSSSGMPAITRHLEDLNDVIIRRVTDSGRYSASEISQFRKRAPGTEREEAERSLASLWLRAEKIPPLPTVQLENMPELAPLAAKSSEAGEARSAVLRTGHFRALLISPEKDSGALLDVWGRRAFQLVIGLLALVLFLVYLIVSGMILSPLRQLLRQMQDVDNNDENDASTLPTINIPGSNEVAQVAHIFNDRSHNIARLRERDASNETRFEQESTARKSIESTINLQKNRAEAIYQLVDSPIILLDKRRVVEYLNIAAEDHPDLGLGNALGKHLSEVLTAHTETGDLLDHRIGYWLSGEMAAEPLTISISGDELMFKLKPQIIRNEQHQIVQCALIFATDSAAQANQSPSSESAASSSAVRVDMLTGLPGHRQFEQALSAILAKVNTADLEAFIAFFDIDRLGRINDSSGHEAGDELIRQIAQIIDGTANSAVFDATAFRLEADKFIIVASDTNEAELRSLVESIRDQASLNGFNWDGHNYQITLSAGIQPIEKGMHDVLEIQRGAFSACQAAKNNGRDQVVIASDALEMHSQQSDEHLWVERIRQGIEKNLFHLTTQPLINLKSDKENAGSLCFEALVQLEDEEGFWNAPGSFLPIAEKYGLSNQIDRWVVREVFAHLNKHPNDVDALDFCTINITGPSLIDEGFVDFVIKQFESIKLPPEKICFEISEESVTSRLTAARAFIQPLHQLGCRISIDDFSTGLSGIKSVLEMPISFIKLDHRLTSDLSNNVSKITVESLLKIADLHDIKTMAAHIEDHNELKVLKNFGFSHAQGFGLGRPSPVLFSHTE